MLKKFLKVSMTNNLKIAKGLCVGASFLASLALAQSANAVVYDWQFTNENGNVGLPTDIVAGEVEFNDFDVFPGAGGVSATRLEINRVDGFDFPSSPPFFGDGGIELDTNLVPLGGINSFFFDFSSQIDAFQSNFQTVERDVILDEERLILQGSAFIGSFLTNSGSFLGDADSSTLSFSQQAATPVPFEINPTLGLLLVGGIFGRSRYLKRRKAINK